MATQIKEEEKHDGGTTAADAGADRTSAGGNDANRTTDDGNSDGGNAAEGNASPTNKVDILAGIRNRRTRTESSGGTPEGGEPRVDTGASIDGTRGNERAIDAHDGTVAGADRPSGRGDAGTSRQRGRPRQAPQITNSTESVKDKPSGLVLGGGIPTPPKRAARAAVDSIKVLTATEAKDIAPKFAKTLTTVFKGLDKGIEYTNHDFAEAYIWRGIDPEEVGIIALHLVELGQKSRVVAEAVRKVTAAHRLLEIGIITGPRFFLTWQHYAQHGGFALPTPNRIKSQEVKKTQTTPRVATGGPNA